MLRTQGMDVESLGGEDIDPSPVIDANVEAISAQTGIPQSVLKGNETGERATTEDLKEWYGKVQERREQHVTPSIVRALLDRLIDVGVLDAPQGGSYEIEWPPLAETSEEDMATIQLNRSKTAKNLASVIPGFGSEEWRSYVQEGDLPEIPDGADVEPMDTARLPDGMPAGDMTDLPQGGQGAMTDGGGDDGTGADTTE
jgi:hypothetical protein